MKSRISLSKTAAALFVTTMLFAASCTPDGANRNAGNANNANSSNSNSSASSGGGRPADATPMGQTAPGYFQAGPNGNVSLRFTAPQDGEAIQGNSVAPTFTITGYPIYKDADRNKGQHIHVILDNEPYEANYDPSKPFSPENGKFNNLSPGTHTLRSFPSRDWHESIKQTEGAFDMIVFNVGRPTVTTIDKRAPLLTYSRPKGENRFKDDPRGLMLDFYVSNAKVGINDFKVKYTLNGKISKILTSWEPVWWKWEELGPGDYTILLELLDNNNKPVPYKVGNLDYNRTERKFKILTEGERPASDHAGNSNTHGGNSNAAPANRNGGANRNTGANRNRP